MTDLTRDMVADIDFLVVQKHAIDGLDSAFSSFCGFVVDKTVALGATVFIGGNLARENVAESGEGVMESLRRHLSGPRHREHDTRAKHLVVNLLIKIFNENVALTGLAEGRIALRPHDPANGGSVRQGGTCKKWRDNSTMHGF
jgi:hypothetical protein